MSVEGEEKTTRPPEIVKIAVQRCSNLKGSKSDIFTSLIRVEFGQTLLGESSKIETTKESKVTEYNFTTSFECSFDEPYSFDGICQKPIVVTVVEVLPKDKKAKEERTNIVGQSCVDLLPLLKGSKYFTKTIPLTSPAHAVGDVPSSEQEQPEIDVVVSVATPLLSSHDVNGSNIFTIQVDSAYSVPESWHVSSTGFTYSISLPVPITAQKENIVVIPNGTHKAQGEKELTQKRKWSIGPSSSGMELLIHESNIEKSDDQEHGDLRDENDLNFRRQVMMDKSRVTWNCDRRCFMSPDASQSFQEKIAHNRTWPVEIVRQPVSTVQKAKGKQQQHTNDEEITFHGIAYVNMAPLLYPGIKRIQGAYLVRPYIEGEVYEKTKRKGNFASDDVPQIAVAGANRNLTPSNVAKPQVNKTGQKDSKTKPSLSTLKTDPLSDAEVTDAEGQQYLDARTFITLTMELDKPLVPKRPPSSLARKVAELIPPRPTFSKKSGGAKKAVEDYHAQIINVANHLVDEFRHLNGEDMKKGILGQSHEDMEARRRAFMYELNTSGKYFAFKEQMKNAVIKIVREKYFHTSSFTSKEELQAFLSDLYVFLVDEMHKGLSKALSIDEDIHAPPSVVDSVTLKHFAAEAEVNQNYELAAKYYQERLARSKNDADHWLDYGTFCLLIGDISKAEECFKETIAINQKHFSGLLLNGCLSLMQEKYEEAETFFEAATCYDSTSVVAWTILGLYYDSLQNDIGAERAFLEANRTNAVTIAKNMPQETTKSVSEAIPEEVQLPATEESDMNQDSDTSTSKTQKQDSYAILGEGSNQDDTDQSSHTAVDMTDTTPPPPTTEVEDKPPEIPPPITQPPPAPPPISCFLQTANYLLNVHVLSLAEGALAHELVCAGPSAMYHTLLGRLDIQKKNYMEAESSLNQALVLNHQSSDAWSLMGHVKFLSQRLEEARDCYERTLDYIDEPADVHSVLLRLASIYLKHGLFEKAKDKFLSACKRSPSPVAWLGVGTACYELGSLDEAEDALSEANILNNTDPEIWAYLSLVCLKTGRQLEAEQSYKYAVKFKLQDENLLDQLHTLQEHVGFGNPIAT